jgi:hypothetical protein
MAEKIMNKLKLSGSRRNIEKVKKYLRTKNADGSVTEYDMKKIIPAPTEFQSESNQHSLTYLINGLILNENDEIDTTSIQTFRKLQLSEKIKIFQSVINLMICKVKYDHTSIVDWNYKKLGCKYIHDGEYIEGINEIQFITTNGNGTIVIKELSRLFPEIVFELRYDLDTISSDYGVFVVKDGHVLKNGEFSFKDEPVTFFNI